MEISKPSLDDLKDNLLRSPYYFEKYSKEIYRERMQTYYNIDERLKCFYSVIKTVFPMLSTFCINSPTKMSVLIHSHEDDYGSIKAFQDFFALNEPYVDLQQDSSMISHLQRNSTASMSQLLQMLFAHYMRVYPHCSVLQLFDNEDGIVNVKIIATSGEEEKAIMTAIEGIFDKITDEIQLGAARSSSFISDHFQCVLGEIEQLSGSDLQFIYEECPLVKMEKYTLDYVIFNDDYSSGFAGEIEEPFVELKRETATKIDTPCHNCTISAYFRYETTGDTYLLTCGHKIRNVPEKINLYDSSRDDPIVLKQAPEEAVVVGWTAIYQALQTFLGSFMASKISEKEEKAQRKWISWMWPNCFDAMLLAKSSSGTIPFFCVYYNPSVLAIAYDLPDNSQPVLKFCVSDVAVVSLNNSSAESSRRSLMKSYELRNSSKDILEAYKTLNRGRKELTIPSPTTYRGLVKYTIQNQEVTLKVIGQGHRVVSSGELSSLYEIWYVATHISGAKPVNGHSGSACINSDNKVHSFLTSSMRIQSPQQSVGSESSFVDDCADSAYYYYLLTPAHFALAQTLELIGEENDNDIRNLKIVDLEWRRGT